MLGNVNTIRCKEASLRSLGPSPVTKRCRSGRESGKDNDTPIGGMFIVHGTSHSPIGASIGDKRHIIMCQKKSRARVRLRVKVTCNNS